MHIGARAASPVRRKDAMCETIFGADAMSRTELFVNGKKVVMNRFLQNLLTDLLMAFLRNLRDVEISDITRVDVTSPVVHDEGH